MDRTDRRVHLEAEERERRLSALLSLAEACRADNAGARCVLAAEHNGPIEELLEPELRALELFAGFALPADVRRYFKMANGMDDCEMDGDGVSFWSIAHILSDPDAKEPGDGIIGGAVAFADVLINSWYFRMAQVEPGRIVIRSDVDPDYEAPSLSSFFKAYLEDPRTLCI